VTRRHEIELTICRNRAAVIEHFASMPAEVLRQPVTRSGADPERWWRPLDHLSHLVLVEHNMNAVVRVHLDGSADPIRVVIPALSTPEETMTYVDTMNDDFATRYWDASFDDVLRAGEEALSETYEVLAMVDDDRLDEQMPGVPWSGGTIGAVLTHNAGDHFRRHRTWVHDGLEHHLEEITT
jgi:Protein of unknown function (DUF1706)